VIYGIKVIRDSDRRKSMDMVFWWEGDSERKRWD
jgi:hypothetical protein